LDAVLVTVTDRSRKSIGRIGCRRTVELQYRYNHVLHLFLRGRTCANNC